MRTFAMKSRPAPAFGPATPNHARAFRRSPAVRRVLQGDQVLPKLKIGAVDDPAEREADRVADRVMRMPEADTPRGGAPPAGRRESAGFAVPTAASDALHDRQESALQRKCACGGSAGASGECVQCASEREATLRRRAAGGTEPRSVPTIVRDALRSPSQPLGAGAQAFFGSRFGHDFSRVRVHTDQRATESAHSLSASAFTVGQNLVFGTGQYKPESPAGKRLIAHELAHVVQQSREGSTPSSPSAVSRLESAADRAADSALSDTGPIDVWGAAKGGVQLNAEVYIWNPHVDGFGHAAIKLCDGTYISWWPVSGGDKKQQYWSGWPGGGHSYAVDIGPGGEGKAQDATYDLGCNCLDEKAIENWYDTNFGSNPAAKWAVLNNSCSDVAHQAINKGSSVLNPCYASISHSNLFWTPKDLGAYADCQSRWCQSKAAGPLHATGRYLWEGVKEIAGGWAWNTLKSLWWKSEIVTHELTH